MNKEKTKHEGIEKHATTSSLPSFKVAETPTLATMWGYQSTVWYGFRAMLPSALT
jgi:hypothetical protein